MNIEELNKRVIELEQQLAEYKSAKEINSLSFIAEQMPAGIIICNMQDKIIWCNSALLAITGYSQQELVGNRPGDVFHDDSNIPSQIRFKRHNSSSNEKIVFPVKVKLKNGDLVWTEISNTPILDSNGKIIGQLEILNNIEEKIKQNQEISKLSLASSHSQMGIVINNSLGEAEWYNASFVKLTGYEAKDIIGKRLGDVFGPNMKETELIRSMRSDNNNRSPITIRVEIESKNGDSKWFEVSNVPVFDEDQNMIHQIESFNEISDLKRTEIELTRRNEALDAFVYTASHDLRQPVVGINSLIDILKLELNNQPDFILEILDALEESSSKLELTLQNLLEISRLTYSLEKKKKTLSINEVIDDICSDFGILIEETNAEIIRDIVHNEIGINPTQFKSLLGNLVLNSLQHCPKDIRPIIHIKSELSRKSVVFTIRDNGEGIDLDNHGNKIFELFERASDKRNGTGIGLYLVKRIVELNNGSVRIKSKPNHGTVITLKLPLK